MTNKNREETMVKLGEMNKETESKLKCLIFGTFVNIILGYLLYTFNPFDIKIYMSSTEIRKIFILPIVVIITLVFHEFIHIICFKIFGKGQAKIRVKREKEAGAIVVQQMNPNVLYSKNETICILLSPLILITFISIPLLAIPNITYIIYLNCVLNAMGSSIDMYITLRLLTGFKGDIRIQYNNGESAGMIIYKA